MNDAVTIVSTGIAVAWMCGLLGVFIVLRRMSMLGDAISHAVLPGLVVAYLIGGERSSPFLFVGAAVFGVGVTLLIEWLHKKARMQQDASIGLSFTLFFSVGILLVSRYAGNVDIDADCVLHGDIGMIPFDTWQLGNKNMGARHLWLIGGGAIITGCLLWIGRKALSITTFNPEFASALGIAVGFWHYALMGGVSMATVLAFEAVGAILVVAFLVIPPAAAWFWSKKLNHMLLLVALFGVISSVLGYQLAKWLNNNISAMMSTVGFVIFLFSWSLNPRTGWLWRLLRRPKLSPHRPF